jgi:hypothetical protein
MNPKVRIYSFNSLSLVLTDIVNTRRQQLLIALPIIKGKLSDSRVLIFAHQPAAIFISSSAINKAPMRLDEEVIASHVQR